MPARRRTGLWIAGVGMVAAAACAAAFWLAPGRRPPAGKPGPASAAATASMADLARSVGEGNSVALGELVARTLGQADTPPTALSQAEVEEWAGTLRALRSGFLQFNPAGRASTLRIAGRAFQRLAVEPAPADWTAWLQPVHALMAAGLDDARPDVRVAALAEVSRLWSWSPGRGMLPAEEDALAAWKQGLHAPVVRRLGDAEEAARIAAVKCLGELPIASAAAPAVAYLDDPKSAEVRKQVLVSFARRPALLSEDEVLRHLSTDNDPTVVEVARIVLEVRGLNQEQISLGRMIFHPKAEIRASVMPLLRNRTDIDPVIWLMRLSHDPEESVRLGAVDALAARMSPEVGQRLAEMARTDRSPAVRKSAARFLSESEKTAALPPLPGSPSLNPRAN